MGQRFQARHSDQRFFQSQRQPFRHGGADPQLLDTFIRVLRGELPNPSTTLHGMLSTAVGQAAELARRENRVVMVEELLQS